jgi:glutathione S-transferase
MPKLYYSVVTCGAASFIAAFTAKVQLQCEQVDHKTHLTGASGVDFYSVNPKGNVPCLVLDDGTVLNENIAVLQYIADQVRTNYFHDYYHAAHTALLHNRLLTACLLLRKAPSPTTCS